jgi:hypothetical protein
MKILWWIHVLLGLLAIGSGAMVLHGVLKVVLSGNRVAWFLRCSLIAAMAGLLPLTRHISPVQGICMLSVYCAGAVVLAWRKFCLAGPWRAVFAFFIVAVLYLNVVSVSIRLFNYSPAFVMVSAESGSLFEIAQFFFAVRMCRAQRT